MKLTLSMLAVVLLAQAPSKIDTAFDKFWAAKSPNDAEKMVDDIVKTGVTFDEAMQRLKTGRTYTAQKTGIVILSNRTKDGIEHFYALNVPANYNPARRYQVRFQLHGGVGGRQNNQPRGNGESPLPGADTHRTVGSRVLKRATTATTTATTVSTHRLTLCGPL